MKTLETERLILRSWDLSDSKDLFEYAQSELVGPRAGWPPHENEEKSKEIIENFIKHNEVWAIELKSEKKVIGSIGLHKRQSDPTNTDPLQKEIGYVLSPKYWGMGIMPEAVKCVLHFGFTEEKLNLIWCACDEDNHNSKRVIEKCKFKYKFKRQQEKKLLNKTVISCFHNISKEEYVEEYGN